MDPRIINMDVLSGLASLPAGFFHAVMTSPPYWRLRSYQGVSPTTWSDGQVVCLGAEADPESFVRHLVEVFDGVWRVLRDDGVLFVNLGETYAASGKGSGGGYRNANDIGTKIEKSTGHRKPPPGYKDGDRCGIPERFALAMQAAGWWWRDTIRWCKRSPMPSSQSGWRWMRCRVKIKKGDVGRHGTVGSGREPHGDVISDRNGAEWEPCPGCKKCSLNDGYILRRGRFRTTAAEEPVFVFAKSEIYFMDDRAAAEPVTGGANPKGSKLATPKEKAKSEEGHGHKGWCSYTPDLVETRTPRSWWPLSSEPLREKHFAAFPTALVRKCLEMATSKAGCCVKCGSPYAPVVESERIPTRPGSDSKVGTKGADSLNLATIPERMDANVIGNRDPQRHISVTRATGYRPTCDCRAGDSIPCRVLDPFLGSGTVGQVANHLGLDWRGVEASQQYVEIANRRALIPLKEAKESEGKGKSKRKSKPSPPAARQATLAFE